MTMIDHPTGPARPRRVTSTPIVLRRRAAGGFQTQTLKRHRRPSPTPQISADKALRLAIVRTPAFHGGSLATAVSLAFPFALALLVLDALGVTAGGSVSPTLAEAAPLFTKI
ncbi:hypothetical protein [Algirhabdus cladophorae]|uniref:hypothetical protein n=1 Tax=Algirhabdus cladophorae TaxID=3377108 RepID=UPI003B8486CF